MKKKLFFKYLIIFILFFSFSVGAGILYSARDISFEPKSGDWQVDNLQDALNDLYNNYVPAETVNEIKTWEFDYTGNYQTFESPYDAYYQIELWGAQGGSHNSHYGGYGAYTKGTIFLKKGEELYLYVGGAGTMNSSAITPGGYNGGGTSATAESGSGGGATDVRLINGNSSNFESLKSRIMVAAGGGGAGSWSGAKLYGHGGDAGGLNGYNGSFGYYSPNDGYQRSSIGAKQTMGGLPYINKTSGSIGLEGTFGVGGNANSSYGGGGGGGYYGGGGGGWSNSIVGDGSGGSSYISGHNGCNSINESSTSTNLVHNGNIYHYSNKYFTNTLMIDGAGYSWDGYNKVLLSQPTKSGTATRSGNSGNGYAKITVIKVSRNEPVFKESIPTSYDFYYSNNYHEFTAPIDGNYRIELWGASGGSTTYTTGGYGAYTSGEISLKKGTKLYIYVGESNNLKNGTYNGGGAGSTDGKSGGGATDIRTIKGAWNDTTSLRSRIMVAGGGGGGAHWSGATSGASNGHAGGLIGYQGLYAYSSNNVGYTTLAGGGTQTSGGVGYVYKSSGANGNAGIFGIGGSAESLSYGGGGGGGWYGGGSGNHSNSIVSQGGGGSSYISGHAGCIGINSNGDSNASSYSKISDSLSYTGYKFTNTAMIDGAGYSWSTTKGNLIYQTNPATGAKQTGNVGDGFARITLLN